MRRLTLLALLLGSLLVVRPTQARTLQASSPPCQTSSLVHLHGPTIAIVRRLLAMHTRACGTTGTLRPSLVRHVADVLHAALGPGQMVYRYGKMLPCIIGDTAYTTFLVTSWPANGYGVTYFMSIGVHDAPSAVTVTSEPWDTEVCAGHQQCVVSTYATIRPWWAGAFIATSQYSTSLTVLRPIAAGCLPSLRN